MVYIEDIDVLILYNIISSPYAAGVLPKSTTRTHIEQNIDIFNFELSADDMEEMLKLDKAVHYCWNPEKVTWDLLVCRMSGTLGIGRRYTTQVECCNIYPCKSLF